MSQVFLSYRQTDEAQRQRVRSFGERLRKCAIDVVLDQFFLDDNPGGPDEGGDKWSSDHALKRGPRSGGKDFVNAGWRAHRAGWVYYLRGQSVEVIACADRAETNWREAQTGTRERAIAIRLRGRAHELENNYSAAIAAYREAVELDLSLDSESPDVAIGLSDLADAEYKADELDAAERDYCEALRIHRIHGNHEGIGIVTGNLASLALYREDWVGAEVLAREALPLSERVGRQELIGSNCHRLARALCAAR